MKQRINGVELHHALTAGYSNLKKNMASVNDLNVFPVPDGDTGTNMVHTFGGGLESVDGNILHAGDYMKQLSYAILPSARGNSGVIFSQFFHGLARSFDGKESIAFDDWTDGFRCATEDAYRSILSPTEGTILTVIRETAEFLPNQQYDTFQEGMQAILEQMKASLAKTPDLLAVLKEAGVVDSGGAGLVHFFSGVHAFFCGVSIDEAEGLEQTGSTKAHVHHFGPDSDMEYGYCTEFILQLMHAKTDIAAFSRQEFIAPLQEMGDSIVVVVNDTIVKVHIHTFTPEKVLAYARQFGEFVTLKIENMSVQHSETREAVTKEKVKYAIVAVASGKGIVDYFYGIGATVVIDGGQTNNPSVEDFMDAFSRYDAEHIIVLPNNSNIIFTANQAAEMYDETDVRVIPTKSIVEGYSALSMMNLWCDTVEELIDDMSSGLSTVTTAYVTTATRNTTMNGVEVVQGNYIGLVDKEIVGCDTDRVQLAGQVIQKVMQEQEKEVIIAFYGANVSVGEAEAFCEQLREKYPLADVGFIEGKQEIYDYIISLE